MRKVILSFTILTLVFFGALSCEIGGGNEPPGPQPQEYGAINISATSTGSGGTTVELDRFVIQLVRGTQYSEEFTVAAGESKVVDNLVPGTYVITVQGYAGLVEKCSGSSTVDVPANETVTASVQLTPIPGELSIILILPEDPTGTGGTEQRICRDGDIFFTFDANGLVTRVDNSASWNYSYEEFTIENGLRTSSIVHRPYNWPYLTSPIKARERSVITHDAQGRETIITYYLLSGDEMDPSDDLPIYQISLSYSETGRTLELSNLVPFGLIEGNNGNYDGNYIKFDESNCGVFTMAEEMVGTDLVMVERPLTAQEIQGLILATPEPVTTRVYDELDRLTQETVYQGGLGTYWYHYTVENPGDTIRVDFQYDGYNRIGEILYVNDLEKSNTAITLDPDTKIPLVGLTTVDTPFGPKVIYEFTFGPVVPYGEGYAQTQTISPMKVELTDDIPFTSWWRNSELRATRVDSIIYDSTLEGIGTISYPLEFENGTVADGQVNYYIQR